MKYNEQRYTALICEHGHIVTEHLENLVSRPDFCERCGAANISKCKNCSGRILGAWPDFFDLSSHPPPSNCTHCGKPYPWRDEAIQRAKRVARMQAEVYELDQETAEELANFAVSVAEDRATPEETLTFGRWFKAKAGKEAAQAVGGVLKDLATSVISDVIRKTMLGS